MQLLGHTVSSHISSGMLLFKRVLQKKAFKNFQTDYSYLCIISCYWDRKSSLNAFIYFKIKVLTKYFYLFDFYRCTSEGPSDGCSWSRFPRK